MKPYSTTSAGRKVAGAPGFPAWRRLLLALVWLASSVQALDVTVSNYASGFEALHGVADKNGVLIASGGGGVLGRVTASDATVNALVVAGDIAGLNAVFQPFGSSFPLPNLSASGTFEATASMSTRASQNSFGGSSIFLWLFRGSNRLEATEYLLVKLNAVYATDPEIGVGPDGMEVYLRPSSVATLFAGAIGPGTHDYGLGGGAVTIFRMIDAAPTGANLPPVASNGTLNAVAGQPVQGQVNANDPDQDPITFSIVTAPGKGSLTVFNAVTGAFTYTATVGQSGADSFTFRASDGELQSEVATVNISISPPPPNQPPQGEPKVVHVVKNDRVTGVLEAVDPEGTALSFSLQTPPTQGQGVVQANGAFAYVPNDQFTGMDRFTFRVTDSGGAFSDVEVLLVVGTAAPGWAWMTGEAGANLNGVHGTPGTPASGNRPGARSGAAGCTIGSVHYLFGGRGRGASGGQGLLNDLWRFNAETQQWTFLSGATGVNDLALYGLQGTGTASTKPGARTGAVLWAGLDGSLWMFGGTGLGTSAAAAGELNDLWNYQPETGIWTWVAGTSGINGNGDYGTLGQTAAGRTPGGRSGAVGWVGSRGELWLFGGRGRGATGTAVGMLDDLWRYVPGAGWAHISGSTALNAAGRYAENGVSQTTTGPGARTGASGWVDAEGRLWLFGGNGYAAKPQAGFLSDLWVFDPATRLWKGGIFRPSTGTWRTSPGLEQVGAAGQFGMLGVAADANHPPARSGAVAVRGGDGLLWLFGGVSNQAWNDVWSFDPATSQWTWRKGGPTPNQAGVYGQKGVAAASNSPGARSGATGMVSQAGHLWVFGGAFRTQDFADGWRLELPRVAQSWISAVTPSGTSAQVSGRFSVNVTLGTTEVSFEYRKAGQPGAWTEVPAGSLPVSGSVATVAQVLSGLSVGTEYEVRAVAINAGGRSVSLPLVFRTTGTASGAPTVRFATASGSVSEAAGSSGVLVTLDPPVSEVVTVALSGSGTAVAGTDYLPLPAQVRFEPGQTQSQIVVGLVNDAVAEGSKTLQLTLGTVTGAGAVVGAVGAFDLTLTDDDGAPTLTPVLASLGTSAVMTVQGAPANVRSRVWKKGSAVVRGATGASLVFPRVSLADAATYQVEMTLTDGRKLTASASLAVVDTSPRRVLGAAGTAVTLATTTAGSGLSFAWEKAGSNDLLGAAGSLTLASPQSADAGTYECVVSLAGAATSRTVLVTLNLVSAIPQYQATRLPTGHVGAAYRHQLEAENGPQGEADAFVVSGLPPGLVATAGGLITGVPRAAVTNRMVRITVQNPLGLVQRDVPLTIEALPAALVGSYCGAMPPMGGVAGWNLGGKVDVVVAGSGSCSATVQWGAVRLSTRGPVSVLENGSAAQVVLRLSALNTPALDLNLTLRPAPAAGQQGMTGNLSDAASGRSASVTGVRLAPAGALEGVYHFAMDLDEDWDGALAVPQGTGFGVATVASSGRVTLAGRSADGGVMTGALMLGQDGSLPFFALSPVSLVPAALTGGLTLTPGNTLRPHDAVAGELAWTRLAAPAKSAAKGYRGGFGPVTLEVEGATYQGPTTGGILANLPATSGNARLSFENRALVEGALTDVVFTIANGGGVRQVVTVPAHPASVTFRLDAKPAGGFSGKFILPGATPVLVRRGSYQGLMVRLPDGSFRSAGYYLVAQPPEPGQTGSTAPELSGGVVLSDN